MKKLLVAFLATLAVCSFGQDLKETHGKTNAQILAMGYDKWYAFYTKLEGESTAGMSQASWKYSEALAWRNDGLIKKLPIEGRIRMSSLRIHLVRFEEKVLQAGMGLTGGGTIWHVIGAGARVSLEETLYGVLGGKVKAAPAMIVSKVTKAMDALVKDVANSKPGEFYPEFKKAETLKLCQEAKAILKGIVGLAAKLDRKGSDRVLQFCLDRIGDAQEQKPGR